MKQSGLICCYLIDRLALKRDILINKSMLVNVESLFEFQDMLARLGVSSDDAIAEFDQSRGETQAREQYLAALRRRGRPQ